MEPQLIAAIVGLLIALTGLVKVWTDVTNSLNTNVAKLGVVVEGLTDAVKELKNR